MSGECGLRGGYFEFVNVNDYSEQIALKMKSVNLCSNTVGMLAMGLMVNPPKKGRNSDEVVRQYEGEKKIIFDGLKTRAKMVTEKLNQNPYISCTEVEGAMYAFPTIKLPQKFAKDPKHQGKAPDLIYCLQLLEETGIMTVPGSGFV